MFDNLHDFNTKLKQFLTVGFTALTLCLFMPNVGFADDPIFLADGPTITSVAAGTSMATEEVVAEPVWLLGCSYNLNNATSAIAIYDVDDTTGAKAATNIIWSASASGAKTETVFFKYPIKIQNGIYAKLHEANVTLYYVTEVKRRKLPF